MHQTIENKTAFEVKRKLFHLCAIFFPLLYSLISKYSMCLILLVMTLIVAFIDIYKHRNAIIKEFVERFFGFLLREQERNSALGLSGATYMVSGLLLSCVIFPKELTIIGWLILIISDSLAAIIGIIYGSACKNGKSFAGSFAFFASALMISIYFNHILYYHTSWLAIIVSCAVTTIAEFFCSCTKINDNFLIPLTYCGSISFLNFII